MLLLLFSSGKELLKIMTETDLQDDPSFVEDVGVELCGNYVDSADFIADGFTSQLCLDNSGGKIALQHLLELAKFVTKEVRNEGHDLFNVLDPAHPILKVFSTGSGTACPGVNLNTFELKRAVGLDEATSYLTKAVDWPDDVIKRGVSYHPDVLCFVDSREHGQDRKYILIGEVKSRRSGSFLQIWKQTLIGLFSSDISHGLLVSPGYCDLLEMKIERKDGRRQLFTKKEHFKLISGDMFDAETFLALFKQMVSILLEYST